ncbi:MAG: HAD family hydrolase [Phycisphaerales bacterium]
MRALISDFDGVILNSEPIHEAAIRDALQDLNLAKAAEWSDWSRFVGHGDREAFRRMLEDASLLHLLTEPLFTDFQRLKKHHITHRLADAAHLAYPVTLTLLRAVHAAGLTLAVCSGSRRHEVIPVLDALNLTPLLSTVVTCDDVANTKPDPEPYLLAATRLNLPPSECLAIEDTPVGVTSARAAGCRVLAVLHSAPEAVLRAAGAHDILRSPEDFALDSIRDRWPRLITG